MGVIQRHHRKLLFGAGVTDLTVVDVILSPTTLTGEPAEVMTISVRAENASGQRVPGAVITADSSNHAVCTVQVIGTTIFVTFVGAGTADVTATVAAVESDACAVTCDDSDVGELLGTRFNGGSFSANRFSSDRFASA